MTMNALALCTQETIEIDDVRGCVTRIAGAHRLGDFAAHRLTIEDDLWRITHLPTGCAIARGFTAIEPATNAMAEIARLRNDWSVISEDDITPKLQEAVTDIAQRFGGFVGLEPPSNWRRSFTFNGYSVGNP